MKIGIWFQGEFLGTAQTDSRGQIIVDGPKARLARRRLMDFSDEADGEHLLRLATQRMRGFWNAREVNDEGGQR